MKIAIITGASRGLGKSMALHVAEHGHGVIVTYLSKKAEADDVVAQIEGAGGSAAALQLDASDQRTFAAFAASVKEALQRKWQRADFDALINNAGIGAHASFETTTIDQFDSLVNVHLKGPFFLTQTLLPLMKDGGRILNVSTGLTRIIYPGYAAYASMKGAIETLTKYQAQELGSRKIAVNVIAPGAIETDFGGGAVRDNKELNARIASMTALGRVGLPDDVGAAVRALLGDDAAWINAQRIEVSGGQSI